LAQGLTVNTQGRNIIKTYAGYHNSVYVDVDGKQKVCWGHVVVDVTNNNAYTNVSTTQCNNWFDQDLASAANCVRVNVKVPLNSNQFSALSSFTTDVGCDKLKSSSLLTQLNAGNYAAVPGQMGVYVKVNGKNVNVLVNRRKAEGALWTAAVPTTKPTVTGTTKASVDKKETTKASVAKETTKAGVVPTEKPATEKPSSGGSSSGGKPSGSGSGGKPSGSGSGGKPSGSGSGGKPSGSGSNNKPTGASDNTQGTDNTQATDTPATGATDATADPSADPTSDASGNGDESAAMAPAQSSGSSSNDNIPGYGIALIVIGGVCVVAGVIAAVVIKRRKTADPMSYNLFAEPPAEQPSA